jgi:hypothetical protein
MNRSAAPASRRFCTIMSSTLAFVVKASTRSYLSAICPKADSRARDSARLEFADFYHSSLWHFCRLEPGGKCF